MELWDLVDEHRRPLGKTHPRGRQYPMPAGTYHTVVTVITVDTDGWVLLTRRAPTKGMYPGYLEVTGGSGIVGEDSLTSALRELREETGLCPPADDLELLGTLREPSAFMDIYLYRLPGKGSDTPIMLQDGETVDACFVTFRRFEEMIHKGAIPPPVAMRYGFVLPALYERIPAASFVTDAEPIQARILPFGTEGQS